MSGETKFGIASVLILAIAAAPALACLIFITQNASHNCCPLEKPLHSVIARCCVYSPATTTDRIDSPAPMIATEMFVASNSLELTPDCEPLVIPSLATSPPGCNSILRI